MLLYKSLTFIHDQRYSNQLSRFSILTSPFFCSQILMPDLWGGERPIEDDLLVQLLEREEQPAQRVHEIPFSRLSSSRPQPSPPQMARSKSPGKKKPNPENNPNPPAQPDSQARVPSTSGRENIVPDPRIQVRARPQHSNLPDVEFIFLPSAR